MLLRKLIVTSFFLYPQIMDIIIRFIWIVTFCYVYFKTMIAFL